MRREFTVNLRIVFVRVVLWLAIISAVVCLLTGCGPRLVHTPDGPLYQADDFFGSRRVVVANNQSCHCLDIAMEGLVRTYCLGRSQAFNVTTHIGYSPGYQYLVEVWRVDPNTRQRVGGYASRHFSFYESTGALSWQITDRDFEGQHYEPSSTCGPRVPTTPPSHRPYVPAEVAERATITISANQTAPVDVGVYDVNEGSGRKQVIIRGLRRFDPPYVYAAPLDGRTLVFEAVSSRDGRLIDSKTFSLNPGSPRNLYFSIRANPDYERQYEHEERERRPSRERQRR